MSQHHRLEDVIRIKHSSQLSKWPFHFQKSPTLPPIGLHSVLHCRPIVNFPLSCCCSNNVASTSRELVWIDIRSFSRTFCHCFAGNSVLHYGFLCNCLIDWTSAMYQLRGETSCGGSVKQDGGQRLTQVPSRWLFDPNFLSNRIRWRVNWHFSSIAATFRVSMLQSTR